MACTFRDGGSVCALDAGDLAQKGSGFFVDNHHAVLTGDIHAVIRRIRYDVIPTPFAAKKIRVGYAVGWLRHQRCRCEYKEKRPHRIRTPSHYENYF